MHSLPNYWQTRRKETVENISPDNNVTFSKRCESGLLWLWNTYQYYVFLATILKHFQNIV